MQAPSPPLGLGDNLVTAFLDGGSLAGLLEVGYADILFYGMASLFEDGRTDWYVAALLLPNDVTKGNGMPGTLLLHDKRTGVFVLGMAFAGWKCGTSWLGLEVTGVVVLGETLLLPDFVENGVTNRSGANGDRLGNSKVGTNGKGRTSDETTFVFAGLDRSLEAPLAALILSFLIAFAALKVSQSFVATDPEIRQASTSAVSFMMYVVQGLGMNCLMMTNSRQYLYSGEC